MMVIRKSKQNIFLMYKCIHIEIMLISDIIGVTVEEKKNKLLVLYKEE